MGIINNRARVFSAALHSWVINCTLYFSLLNSYFIKPVAQHEYYNITALLTASPTLASIQADALITHIY
jgi:hypothetical protein